MSPGVRLDPGVARPRPDLLVGGAPLRVLRLAAQGVDALDALLAGRAHPGGPALRERLLRSGFLLVQPGPGKAADVTVVVPVRGSSAEVATVLAGVPAGVPVVVVDDGSTTPVQAPGSRLVRHEVSRGPGAARNRGASLATTEIVAFVDADVALPEGWLDRLTGHLAEERVVAVAPRIASGPAHGLAGVLEQGLSALDLGDVPGEVCQGTRLAYVPSTVLLVRRETFLAAGGFDEALHVGEDVDLVWRLLRLGAVRYDPEVVVRHGARSSLRSALQRRRDYGSAAGALDARYPGQVGHLVVSPWSGLPWAAALVHPGLGPVVAAAFVLRGPRALPSVPPDVARRLVAKGQWAALAATGRYAVRPGLPLVLVALGSRRGRRLVPVLAAAYAVSTGRQVLAAGPRQAPARALLRVLDDLAYAAGVWQGCLRTRRIRPLLPRLEPWRAQR